MATSGQIGSRSISAAGDDVGRRRIAANLTLRPQGINSTIADHSLSLSDGGGKIIRFYPRAVASQGQPALPMSNRNGEYNVICFPHAALAKSLQRWDETAKSSPELIKTHSIQGDDDYDHRMLVNALAAAVLVVLVISGEWIFSALATIP